LDAAIGAFNWTMIDVCRKMKPEVENYVAIANLQKWSLKNNDWTLLKQQSNFLQNYFPERLGCAFIISPPWYVSGVWKIIKTWLDERTSGKVFFLEEDKPRDTLLQIIDEDALPEELGGTLKIPPPELNMFNLDVEYGSDHDSDVEREFVKAKQFKEKRK